MKGCGEARKDEVLFLEWVYHKLELEEHCLYRHADNARMNRRPKCFSDGDDLAEVLQPTLRGQH